MAVITVPAGNAAPETNCPTESPVVVVRLVTEATPEVVLPMAVALEDSLRTHSNAITPTLVCTRVGDVKGVDA